MAITFPKCLQRDLLHPDDSRRFPAGEKGDGVEVKVPLKTLFLFVICSSLIHGQDTVIDTLSRQDVITAIITH